jgi:hypothetical protein
MRKICERVLYGLMLLTRISSTLFESPPEAANPSTRFKVTKLTGAEIMF